MTSTVILSDNGASSGSAGLKSTAGNDGVLILQTTTSGGTATNAVYVDTSQNVGIGTSSPSAKLSVMTSSAGMQATFGVGTGLNYIAVGSGNSSTYQTRFGYDVSSEYGYIQPYAAAGVADDLAICPSGGNVGIGTSSPAYRLDVQGGDATTGAIRVKATASGSQATVLLDGYASGGTYRASRLDFAQGGTVKKSIIYDYNQNNTADLSFCNSAGTQQMLLDPNGNLLINTTTDGGAPNTKLHILIPASGGGIRTRVTNNGDWASYFQNSSGTTVGNIVVNSSTTTYNTSSDYRLKENIAPMTGALTKVAALKPCTYTWKSTGESSEGFIAHELQEVVPDCVTGEKDAVDENGNPVYQGIDTSFLVATLTAAIQEQQALINNLTERLAALEAK